MINLSKEEREFCLGVGVKGCLEGGASMPERWNEREIPLFFAGELEGRLEMPLSAEATLILEFIINLLKLNNSLHYFIDLMNPRSLFLICILLFTAIIATQSTILTYFVQYEVEQEDDYIETTFKVEAQSTVLVDAINKAKRIAKEVESAALSFCRDGPRKLECAESVQVDVVHIEPSYRMVRKQAIFEKFIVSHEITLKIFNTDNIGRLIDPFLKYPELTLESFEWMPNQEVDSQEAAIKEGLAQGKGLCKQLGLTLGNIVSIEEIIEQEEEKEEAEAQDGEQEQQEIITYRFDVECIAAPKKAEAAKEKPVTGKKEKTA